MDIDAAMVEEAVPRPHWEPRHEWEARVKFVEDNVATHGLEKAINLSLVWGNMKYLGCRYPAGTEALVSDYPEPSLEELRARRKCKDSVAAAKRKKQSSPPPQSFAALSALLSSAHAQSSIKATPPQMQDIANKTCLCKDCLGVSDNESYPKKGAKVLELLKSKRNDFTYEVTNTGDGNSEAWSLVINNETVLTGYGSKDQALEDFMRMLNNWQESNMRPPCEHVKNDQSQTESSSWGYSDNGGGYVDQQGGYGGRGQQEGGYRGRGGGYRGREGGSYGHGQQGGGGYGGYGGGGSGGRRSSDYQPQGSGNWGGRGGYNQGRY